MTRHAFTVPGKPMGKQRPRFTRRSGRSYTPDETLTAENWVKHCALEAKVTPLDGPLAVDITAVSAIPKSWSKKKRQDAIALGYDTRKPDADNIGKLVTDALNGIAYGDDAQVAILTVTKAHDAGEPRVVVSVTQLKETADV
ncbi:MAG: RusA family crossover junction endodeoxyribonuclease [Pseudomonadota bacterium]